MEQPVTSDINEDESQAHLSFGSAPNDGSKEENMSLSASINTGDASYVFPSPRLGIFSSDPAGSAKGLLACRQVRGGLPPRALRRVREYIEANLEDTISIKTLAHAAGLSMYHFARAFKQSEGVTPHAYLVSCRLRRAQELLTQTDLSVSEIARASGFSDQSHCTRRFRERLGVTPSSYRWAMR